MFEVITRFILFTVGVSLTTSTVVLAQVGLLIISAARGSIALLLIWSLFVWMVERRRYPRDNRSVWLWIFGIGLVVSLVMSYFAGSPFIRISLNGLQLGEVRLQRWCWPRSVS